MGTRRHDDTGRRHRRQAWMTCRGAAMVSATAIFAAALVTIPTPADACACGGIATNGPAIATEREQAVITLDDGVEQILMSMVFTTEASSMALLMPTPSPAQVETGNIAAFEELAEITAPTIVTRTVAVGAGLDGSGAADVDVHSQETIGPYDVATLTATDQAALASWLDANGYRVSPEVTAITQQYIAEGWSFAAIKLTDPTTVDARPGDRVTLDPVFLTFPADELVYPMRMSAAAQGTQYVDVYVIANDQMDRADANPVDAAELAYVGALTGVSDDVLKEMLYTTASYPGPPYLTKWLYTLEPNEIVDDFRYTPASTTVAYRMTEYRVQRVVGVSLLGVVVSYEQMLLTVIGLLAVGVLVRMIVRRVRRRRLAAVSR